ncbi:unnamed protein product, partial [Brachionus calyciflorus]
PNLRFLGIESDVVPKFKHLELNFIHKAGLKELDETFLNSQVDLTGVCLELGEEIKFDTIKEQALKSIEKLSFLALYLKQNEIDYIENIFECYGAYLNRGKPNLRTCTGCGINYLEVSYYENIGDYIQKEFDLSDLTKKNLISYCESNVAEI